MDRPKQAESHPMTMRPIDPTAGTAVVCRDVSAAEAVTVIRLLTEREKDMPRRPAVQGEPNPETGRCRVVCQLSKDFPAGHRLHSFHTGFGAGVVLALREWHRHEQEG